MNPSAKTVYFFFIVLALAAIAVAAEPAATKPAGPVGELPRGLDGQPLNLDFEKGTLEQWIASGEAFAKQPVKGDTVTARGRGMASEHAGQFWIGGFEITHTDLAQGTLTS